MALGKWIDVRRIRKMEYPKGYVYELMEQGGPTNVMEPYFMEAVDAQ